MGVLEVTRILSTPAIVLLGAFVLVLLREKLMNIMEGKKNIIIFKYFSELKYQYTLCVFSCLLCLSEIIILFSLGNYIEKIVSVCGSVLSVVLCIAVPLIMQAIMYSVMHLAYRKAYESYIINWPMNLDKEAEDMISHFAVVPKVVYRKYGLFELFSIIFMLFSTLINAMFVFSYSKESGNGYSLFSFFMANKIVLGVIIFIVLVYLIYVFANIIRTNTIHRRVSQIGFGEGQVFSENELPIKPPINFDDFE